MDKIIASFGNVYNKLRSCCKLQQQSAGTNQPLIIANKLKKTVHFDDSAVDNQGKTTNHYRENPTLTPQVDDEAIAKNMQNLVAIQHQIQRQQLNNPTHKDKKL